MKIIGNILRSISPGYSYCSRCHYPWKYTKEHSCNYCPGRSHFALCEKCWNKITTSEKIYYYTKTEYIKNNSHYTYNITISILDECGVDHKTYFREQKLKRIIKNI